VIVNEERHGSFDNLEKNDLSKTGSISTRARLSDSRRLSDELIINAEKKSTVKYRKCK